MENKFDLFIRCAGASELRIIDLSNEEDGDAIIRTIEANVQDMLELRGANVLVIERDRASLKIKKGKVAE